MFEKCCEHVASDLPADSPPSTSEALRESPNSTLVMAYMSLHGKDCNIFKVSSYGNALEAHFGQLL